MPNNETTNRRVTRSQVKCLSSSSGSHQSSDSRHLSTSGRVREMAKVAELQAKMALLERKQALESEVEKLHLQELWLKQENGLLH